MSGESAGDRADRLPNGENATEKLATYEPDGTTGLDYADQRHYQPGAGRFMTADPYLASGGVESPGSWNRYAYVEGDPVNFIDRRGLFRDTPGLLQDPFGFIGSAGGGYPTFEVDAWGLPWWMPFPVIGVIVDVVSGGSTPPAPTPPAEEKQDCNAVLTELPASGEGYYTYGAPNHRWGTASTVAAIRQIVRDWHSNNRDVLVGIGDLSLRGGGDTPRHSSHETGLDADFRPVRTDGRPLSVTIYDSRYSRDRTADLIQAFLSNDLVTHVFFNDRSIQGTTPLGGHHSHFHVRFRAQKCQ
jgi:RHS repeat-associated protein